MKPPYFMLNAWDIWQKCGNLHDRQAWKNFWADIALYVKTNPGQAIFFEELFKEAGLKKQAADCLKIPLPIAAKKLLRASGAFGRERWAEVINEWAKIKADLKTRTQAAILQSNRLIKDFLLAALEKADNPRLLADSAAGGSGLPKRYPKSDVILMLCFIVAESLSAEIIKEGFDGHMDKSIFQLADDTMPDEAGGTPVESGRFTAEILPDAKNPPSFAKLCEEFLRSIDSLDPLSSDWSETERYLSEAALIASQKSEEQAAILRRRALIDDFTGKTSHILNTFSEQLRYIGFNLPAAETAGKLPDSALEACIDALSGLTEALHSYNDLSSGRKGGFSEDKKRVGLLLSTMTDIENGMEVIRQILKVELSAENQEAAGEQDECTEARKMLTAPVPDGQDACGAILRQPDAAREEPALLAQSDDKDAQMELFSEKNA
ncbi:MAG: hypothetical protein LBO03_07070 [Acidaminococcales bacterium]|nr:hypothetical protein [Acidaminococcales bacterium]